MATRTERRQATQNRLKAMSHPLRSEVLRLLTERGPSSPAEMAKLLGAEIANVSHHTKRLVALDCAELIEERPVRGAVEHVYRATERHLVETEEWDAMDPLAAESLLCEITQRMLDDFVASTKAHMIGSDENFHLTRTRLKVDRAGLLEAMEIHERARLEIREIEARSTERMQESGEQPIAVSTSQTCFEMPLA